MSERLSGKIVVIIGASRGIGEAIARAFAAEGAKVVLVSRKIEAFQSVADSINEGLTESFAFACAAYMGEPVVIEEMLDWVEANVGVPQILVNNAATNPYFGPFLTVSDGAWDKTFDVNVKGYFQATRGVAQRLLARNMPGSIINVSSIYGLSGAPLQGVYAMTKAAVISMTRTLAVEFGAAGIRINAICPGLVDTKFASVIVNTPEFSDVYIERVPLGRWA